MISLESNSIDDIWRQARMHLLADGVIQEGRDQPTREILHVAMTVHDPRQRLVFARPMSPAFAIAEVIWMLSGANDASFLRFWNRRIIHYTDRDNVRLHGAYGYRLGSQPDLPDHLSTQLRHDATPPTPRIDQLKMAYQALRHTSHTRQVVLQIWDSKRDLPNPDARSNDVPCNLVSHLLVRNGQLEWLQVMRSNDMIWGLPYNVIQFTTLQEIMAGWLGIEVGSYNHVSDSLHVYQRHWPEIEQSPLPPPISSNHADLRIGPYERWEILWALLVEGAWQLTQEPGATGLLEVRDRMATLPSAYQEWFSVLTAEALRRRRHLTAADEVIMAAGPFWETSWRQWSAAADHTEPICSYSSPTHLPLGKQRAVTTPRC